ncbi:MAG: hypothetical protein NTY09_07090, partial [bacterium]|nr:hypothetical protein [bacterium]
MIPTTIIAIIFGLVTLVVGLLFSFSVFYNTGWYLFRKIKIFRHTKEEMFSDATSEEYRSWQKLERIALVIYTVIWILFMIESLIGIAIGV